MENFTSIYLFWFSILLFGKLQTIERHIYINILKFDFNFSTSIIRTEFLHKFLSTINFRVEICEHVNPFFSFFITLDLSITISRFYPIVNFYSTIPEKIIECNHRLTDSRPSTHVYPTKYTHSDTYFSNSIIGPKNQPTFQPEESNKPTPLSSSIDINNSLESHLNFEYPIA